MSGLSRVHSKPCDVDNCSFEYFLKDLCFYYTKKTLCWVLGSAAAESRVLTEA